MSKNIKHRRMLLSGEDRTVKDAADMQLYLFASRYYDITDSGLKEKHSEDFAEYNYSRYKAKKIILSYEDYLIKIKDEIFPEDYCDDYYTDWEYHE